MEDDKWEHQELLKHAHSVDCLFNQELYWQPEYK